MTAVTMEELAVYLEEQAVLLEEIAIALHSGLVLLGAFFLYTVFFRRR